MQKVTQNSYIFRKQRSTCSRFV